MKMLYAFVHVRTYKLILRLRLIFAIFATSEPKKLVGIREVWVRY